MGTLLATNLYLFHCSRKNYDPGNSDEEDLYENKQSTRICAEEGFEEEI